MNRMLSVPAIILCLVGLGIPNASAATAEKPHPDWNMSAKNSSEATVAAYWACHGHTNTPHSLSYPAGIGYDGYQDCEGSYGANQMCVKLQMLDYYGTYYDRTAYTCRTTVAGHVYAGWSVQCKDAHQGTYRTYGKGTAWPAGTPVSRTGYSSGVYMCRGY